MCEIWFRALALFFNYTKHIIKKQINELISHEKTISDIIPIFPHKSVEDLLTLSTHGEPLYHSA